MSLLSLAVTPEELVDKVDSALSWLAVASQGTTVHSLSAARRAELFVSLGDGDVAALTPDAATVVCDDGDPDSVVGVHNAGKWKGGVAQVLASGREVLRPYAHIIEVDPGKPFVPSTFPQRIAGDKPFQTSGIVQCLSTVRELHSGERKRYVASRRFPQVARVYMREHVVVYEDGFATTLGDLWGLWGGQMWHSRHERLGPDELGDATFALVGALMHAHRRRQEWFVELSLGSNRTGVALATDAVGARSFVRSLSGEHTPRGRRKAMVHWVRDHMRRQRRDDAEPTIKVKAHHRGLQEVQAGRYHARIWPSTQPPAPAGGAS